MATLRLQILGGFELSVDGRSSPDPRAKKARALLAYLALQEGRTVTRDQLAALLWSRSDHQRARHSLSQALSAVRRVFEGAGLEALQLAPEHVRLDADAVDLDARAFATLAVSSDPDALERAALLYRGDLLDGLHINEPGFQTWIRAEQQRFREIAISTLSAVSEAEERDDRFDDAIAAALRLLAVDPLHEKSHRALMRLYAKQGRTDSALRQFRSLETLLQRELAVEPEAATRRLLQTVSDDRRQETAPGNMPHGVGTPASFSSSIVVLPFTDYSAGKVSDPFADGLTDNLITDLSRINGVLVVARNTAFTYRNKTLSTHRIASELGVRYVIEGSVQRSGIRVQLNVRLVDGLTDRQIWSDRFDRQIDDAFLVQNEITARIAAILRLELLQAESQRLAQDPPANLPAWGYAMRGWAELWTKPIRRHSTLEAKRLFEQALEFDPALAVAWTGLARVHYIAALYPFGLGERVESFRRALEAAETAVALNPKSAEAYAELGAALKTQLRYDEAEVAIRTALERNPNYEEGFTNLAMLKQSTGELDEALALFKHSLALAPSLPTDGRRTYFLAQTHLLAGNLDLALDFAHRSMVIDSRFPGPYWVRASVFGLQNRGDLAEPALEALIERDDGLSTVEQVERQYHYIKGMEHALDGLLRAGMPEK